MLMPPWTSTALLQVRKVWRYDVASTAREGEYNKANADLKYVLRNCPIIPIFHSPSVFALPDIT